MLLVTEQPEAQVVMVKNEKGHYTMQLHASIKKVIEEGVLVQFNINDVHPAIDHYAFKCTVKQAMLSIMHANKSTSNEADIIILLRNIVEDNINNPTNIYSAYFAGMFFALGEVPNDSEELYKAYKHCETYYQKNKVSPANQKGLFYDEIAINLFNQAIAKYGNGL